DVRGESFSNVNALRGTVKVDAPRVALAGYSAQQIKATAHIDGRRIGLDGKAAAYGATATANGRVILPEGKEPLDFDVRGLLRHLDLRRLPNSVKAPPAETDVNADYHVAGTPNAMKGDLRFAPSTVAGAHIAQGSTAGFTFAGAPAVPSTRPADIGYTADVTVSDVDLQRVGQAFNVPALDADRYKSSINAHVTARGTGTDPKALNVTASGAIADSTVMGGRIPNLTFDANVANDTAHVKANGAFADFDPAVVSSKPAVKGTVSGTLDL